jgi:DNA-binding NtrC family response regulator
MGKTESWLISWVGETDHQCAEGKRQGELGPIATALKSGHRYDRVYLLTNYNFDRSKAFCAWLEKETGYLPSAVDLYSVELSSPINYSEIYEKVSCELQLTGLPKNGVELTFHLSPGTPAMAAIWIMLARTRFPAKLIQTSKEKGLESVDFQFDLASDFLPEYLQRTDERIGRMAAPPTVQPAFGSIVHSCAAMRQQIMLAQRVAAYSVPVLILGETGTGKELFAQAIHESSPRAGKPFVAVNCGAISKELANAELFGHEKGAFTGADKARPGHFKEAHGGTLFLDEVGDLPLDSQVRLLRALQSKEITPVGSSKVQKVDVRVIAATHRDLAADVAAGRFREDLFHRLAVGILRLPPLREREDDILLLADQFMAEINRDAPSHPEVQHKELSESARKILTSHAWPGNVRELYHALLRASIWAQDAQMSGADIEAALIQMPTGAGDGILNRPIAQGIDLQSVLDEVERHYIARAMGLTKYKKSKAAALLGFNNYQTLSNRMANLGLSEDDTH